MVERDDMLSFGRYVMSTFDAKIGLARSGVRTLGALVRPLCSLECNTGHHKCFS